VHLHGLPLPLSARAVAIAVVVECALVSAVDEEFEAENARVAAVDDAKAVAGRGNIKIRPHLTDGAGRTGGAEMGERAAKKSKRQTERRRDQRGSAIDISRPLE